MIADPLDVQAPMTEEELFAGITDALDVAGWRWMHIHRSDGVTVGSSGFPDLIAVHPSREVVLLLELKGWLGKATPDQLAWLTAANGRTISAHLVEPRQYDGMLRIILGTQVQAGHV